MTGHRLYPGSTVPQKMLLVSHVRSPAAVVKDAEVLRTVPADGPRRDEGRHVEAVRRRRLVQDELLGRQRTFIPSCREERPPFLLRLRY